MKSLFISVMVVVLAACSGTSEENAAKRNAAVELAIDRVERFNALGIDPIQLSEEKLLVLDTGCVLIQLLGIEAGIDVETLKTIGALCEVIRVAAAPAKATEQSAPET